jgi:hypothetical protein
MSNVQGKKMEAFAQSAALGEGLKTVVKAPERDRRRRLLLRKRRPWSKR